MPGIGHLVYGLAILCPLLLLTKNKLNPKVAFIFLWNNYLGPDATTLFAATGVSLHNVLGFALFAIPLSLMYSYASRFSVERSKHFLKFVDGGIREVSWKNSYLLTMAGGISHFFIDQFYHLEQEFALAPWISFTLDEMTTWEGTHYHTFSPFVIFSYVCVLLTLLGGAYCFKRGFKQTAQLLAVVAVTITVAVFAGTDLLFGGEREFATTVFAVGYIFVPLVLVAYVARDVEDHPRQQPDAPKIPRTRLLNIVAGITMILAGIIVVVGIVGFFIAPSIAGLILSINSDIFADPASGASTIQALGIALAILAGMLLVGTIGLFLKNCFCRGIVVTYSTLLLIAAAFPFVIALFLCEKDVVALFEKKGAREQIPDKNE